MTVQVPACRAELSTGVLDLDRREATPAVPAPGGTDVGFRVDVWTRAGQPPALVPPPPTLALVRDSGAPAAGVPGGSPTGRRLPAAVLALTGEIDIDAVPAIAAAATRLLPAADSGFHTGGGSHVDDHLVIVRLGQVTFLDCAALGALVALQSRVRSAGGTFVLEDVSPPALRLLTLTRHSHDLLSGE